MNSLFAAAARAMPSAFALGAWGARGFHSTGMLMGKFSKNQGKNVALSSKRAKKGYYKGKGCRTLGRHLKNTKYALIPSKLPEIVVPEDDGLLKAYVSRTTPLLKRAGATA